MKNELTKSMHIEELLEGIKGLERDSKRIEKESANSYDILSKFLQKEFPLLAEKEDESAKSTGSYIPIRKDFDFSENIFEDELNLILKWACLGLNKMRIRVESKKWPSGLLLTPDYGLKIPCSRRSFSLLAHYGNAKANWKIDANGNLQGKRLKDDDLYFVGFGILKVNLSIKQEQIEKYLEFLQKVLDLKTRYLKILGGQELSRFDDSKHPIIQIENLCETNEVDGIRVKSFIKRYQKCKVFYKNYEPRLGCFVQDQKKLLSELKGYTKSYKLIQKMTE